jgi:homoserine dehydrogenase
VGGGTFALLRRNQEEITRRAGREIAIHVVADQDLARAKRIVEGSAEVTGDAFSVVGNPDIDIVVELIGGTKVAKDLILRAIDNGKHVVTANKALLAWHGNEIFAAAQKRGVMVAFEAAVAGGIPIIKALREGLTCKSDRVDRRHHQRDQQLHSVDHARHRRGLQRNARRSAAPRLRRDRPDLRYRGHRCCT